MSDGGVVLCDWGNSNLILLGDTFTVKKRLHLDSPPHDVSPVNNSNVMVTLPVDKKLQLIQVMPSLRIDQSINVGRKCYGVQVVDDLIYVTCHISSGEGEVIVLDMNGTVTCTHRLVQPDKKPSMFSSPRYITVCPSTRKMFITDYSTHTLSCLMSDGTVVYKYKDKELKDATGVCVDGGGNAIVCGCYSSTVQVIRADGKKCCTLPLLISQDRFSEPWSLAYRQSDNTIILGCYNSDNLRVYKMK